jgi:hypothetical protein
MNGSQMKIRVTAMKTKYTVSRKLKSRDALLNAVTRILQLFDGIDPEELTTAERNVLKIIAENPPHPKSAGLETRAGY